MRHRLASHGLLQINFDRRELALPRTLIGLFSSVDAPPLPPPLFLGLDGGEHAMAEAGEGLGHAEARAGVVVHLMTF